MYIITPKNFFRPLDLHFPPLNKFRKNFNRNNVKDIYITHTKYLFRLASLGKGPPDIFQVFTFLAYFPFCLFVYIYFFL